MPVAPLRWRLTQGPWFDNNLATLEVTREGLRLRWDTGEVTDGRHDSPGLVEVSTVDVGSH